MPPKTNNYIQKRDLVFNQDGEEFSINSNLKLYGRLFPFERVGTKFYYDNIKIVDRELYDFFMIDEYKEPSKLSKEEILKQLEKNKSISKLEGYKDSQTFKVCFSKKLSLEECFNVIEYVKFGYDVDTYAEIVSSYKTLLQSINQKTRAVLYQINQSSCTIEVLDNLQNESAMKDIFNGAIKFNLTYFRVESSISSLYKVFKKTRLICLGFI